jgi:excisionase family DNA binding protein
MTELDGWTNTKGASESTGYSTAYVRRLAHRGRITAKKVGRDWLVDLACILAHKLSMERLGEQKHSPVRPIADETL